MVEQQVNPASAEAPPFQQSETLPPKKSVIRRNCTCCIGAVVIPIFLLILAGVAFFFITKPQRDEADAFIESEVVPALKIMDVKSIRSIASTEFADTLETSRTVAVINGFREKLGPLKSLGEASGGQYNINLKGGFYQYNSPATFEKTTGTISIALRREGTWKLDGININSDALFF